MGEWVSRTGETTKPGPSTKQDTENKRNISFLTVAKDLHESSEVCQSQRVLWDVVTLQSHIFCHPITQINETLTLVQTRGNICDKKS